MPATTSVILFYCLVHANFLSWLCKVLTRKFFCGDFFNANIFLSLTAVAVCLTAWWIFLLVFLKRAANPRSTLVTFQGNHPICCIPKESYLASFKFLFRGPITFHDQKPVQEILPVPNCSNGHGLVSENSSLKTGGDRLCYKKGPLHRQEV